MKTNLQSYIVEAILTDDLDTATSLLKQNPGTFKPLAQLLGKVRSKPHPLDHLRSEDPDFVIIYPSYTCSVGCKMCNTGFADRTRLYPDYSYMTPEQFDTLLPSIQRASNVLFVGIGETMESPHMIGFLDKIRDKETTIYTSGVPLTKKKIRSLIRGELTYLTFSFDGRTHIGHGSGNEAYEKKFWQKVDWVEQIKQEMKSGFPRVTIAITFNMENLEELDDLIATACQHGIREIMLTPMTVSNYLYYKLSPFADFELSKNTINPIMKRWREKGIWVTHMGFQHSIADATGFCPYIDNWVSFTGTGNTYVCEGPLSLPQCVQNFSDSSRWNSFPVRYLRHLHFYSETKALPMDCQTCFITNMKNHAKLTTTIHDAKGSSRETAALTTYQRASRLKQEKKFDLAQENFLKVIELSENLTLKGKAYFHLGEMALGQQNYRGAKKKFELTVQQYFQHEMAFAYLYLLLMLDGPLRLERRKDKYDTNAIVRAKNEHYYKAFDAT